MQKTTRLNRRVVFCYYLDQVSRQVCQNPTAKKKVVQSHIIRYGVETEEQFQFMKEIGCDYIQGYLIGRPVSVEQFEMRYMGR